MRRRRSLRATELTPRQLAARRDALSSIDDAVKFSFAAASHASWPERGGLGKDPNPAIARAARELAALSPQLEQLHKRLKVAGARLRAAIGSDHM